MIIPTILEKNLEEIQKKLSALDDTAPLVQVDMADGDLVEGKTFLDIEKLDTLDFSRNLEVHLMAKNPTSFLENKVKKVKSICAQVEATAEIPEFIEKSKVLGYRVGISVNISTPISLVEPLVEVLDFVQFMCIAEPGAQGRGFDPSVLDKISEFKQKYPEMEIQADGSVNSETLPLLKGVGVEKFAVGSAIFKTGDVVKNYEKLEQLAHGKEKTDNIVSWT